MIDIVKKTPIWVRAHDPEFPYVRVPYEQLEAVVDVLKRGQIRFEVNEETLSIDDGPEMIVVHIRRGTDPKLVQVLLDAAS